MNSKLTNREYRAAQTNSASCYANINKYNCSVSTITAPTPVTAVPPAGNLMRPYKMPDLNPRQFSCNGYKEMSNFCSIHSTTPNNNYKHTISHNSFKPGFNDVSGYK